MIRLGMRRPAQEEGDTTLGWYNQEKPIEESLESGPVPILDDPIR